jgi:hypothetical protein
MKSLKDGIATFWMNVYNYFIYVQHGSSKFMDVNSSVNPLKMAMKKIVLPKKIEIKIPDTVYSKCT